VLANGEDMLLLKGRAVALALWMELGVVGLRCGEFWEEMALKDVNVRNGARVLWMVSVESVHKV
jgi:hypothetical protein